MAALWCFLCLLAVICYFLSHLMKYVKHCTQGKCGVRAKLRFHFARVYWFLNVIVQCCK